MYTFDETIVSDLHKDARGYRPDAYFWEEWSQCGDDTRQAMWDNLLAELSETMDRERNAQAAALANFEAQLKVMKRAGAETTQQAIKWVFHAEKLDRYDLQYGADAVAYHFGMSYQNPYRAVIQECCDQALAVVQEEEEKRLTRA
tara:strand:+ start:261 stop:695 length:435 start_codon:yes stop_codon:yes gene_type:complete